MPEQPERVREEWHLKSHESDMIIWVVCWSGFFGMLTICWFTAWYLSTPADPRVKFVEACTYYSDQTRPTAEMLQAQELRCAEIASKMDWK